MECQCDQNTGDAAAGWMSGSNVQMGAFAVVGYLLYRFSQTLPALIRWPIRLFCSITGLSALWGWVSHLVGTLHVIRRLFKCLSWIWRFMVGSSGEESQSVTGDLNLIDLRLVLLGPSGGGRTSLADIFLEKSETRDCKDPLNRSIKRSRVLDGRVLTVVNTPDVLGSLLGNRIRVQEALRSLQFTSPGPHAFLLVVRVTGSSSEDKQEICQAIRATLELFGDEVKDHILPVLTHTDHLAGGQTIKQLLEEDTGTLRRLLSLCGQRPELVDIRPDLPQEAKRELRRRCVERVLEMRELRGPFIHELQRREDSLREKLLSDMTSSLLQKLDHT
ncbi:GTPase IMAP family member 4 isoform X2 [Austrofundulus limnaeus]|uniref:GTPase IMAP family member 4 isoform X2 n=1 Tax=Austrofundulus limnaeus TaxID=52670 RepID=A0A2I4BY41_AUSLI|nr:PREDICTED: GTPase IMAP family member 4-like isoform X2 [Austrofundulus limnaeus]